MLDANTSVMREQVEAGDWALWDTAWTISWFLDAFHAQFFSKLGGINNPPVISYKNSHKGNLGSYRLNRNEFGMAREINLNKQYLTRPMWSVLATLFHECVHNWEWNNLPVKNRTSNWFHKQWFRDYMEAQGIHCADNGAHEEVDLKGDFFWFIQRHGVKMDPDLMWELGLSPNGNGRAKVKDVRKTAEKRVQEWGCDCTAIKLPFKMVDFDATCNRCKVKFKPVLD
jgi:hypothetical protein